MKTKAAVLRGVGRDWDVVDIEVDAPTTGETIVERVAAGPCDSDGHMVSGDIRGVILHG